MSSSTTHSAPRRISERKRLQRLRSSNEFKIANPYRQTRPPLPYNLAEQLKKIDYLSLSVISELSLSLNPNQYNKHQLLLSFMGQAFEQQENKYRALFGNMIAQGYENDEDIASGQKQHTFQLHIQTKDEDHFNFDEPKCMPTGAKFDIQENNESDQVLQESPHESEEYPWQEGINNNQDFTIYFNH